MYPMRKSDDAQLDALFRAYARACKAPEPSVNFMPNLWQRIEARQSFTFSFRRMANAFVTAAVAVSIALGVYTSVLNSNPNRYTLSYLEALDSANPLDAPEIVAPVSLDLSDSGR